MRICLIGYYDERQYGLRCLEATLDESGHEVEIIVIKSYDNMFNSPTEIEYDILVKKVRQIEPDIIGITVRSPFVWLAKEFTERLRGVGAPIIWGGFHTTVAPEYSIRRPDMILRGEADRTLPLLLDTLSKNGDLSIVPGLWWKENGKINKNPIGPPVQDVDSLPLPVFRTDNKWFIENDRIYTGEILYEKDNMEYETMASRGCPQECTYCANSALIKLYGKVMKNIRSRSPRKIVEEVKKFERHFRKVSSVAFVDEVFSFNLKWVEEFCEVWKKEMDCAIALQMYPTLISEELIKKLKDAGLHYINMGIQSGSERIRKNLYKRHTPNDKIIQTAQLLHRHNITFRVDIIMDNPLEDADDLKQTLDLLLQLPRPLMNSFYSLIHFPGTELTEKCLKEGLINIEDVQGYTEECPNTWSVKASVSEDADPLHLFYKYLILMTNFRYFSSDPWACPPRRHFYPKWFIRWLEGREKLRKDPVRMYLLADKFGKFAHWTYYWTSSFPRGFASKVKTALKFLLTGNWEGISKGFKQLGREVANQFKSP